jgi:hypothetical protein
MVAIDVAKSQFRFNEAPVALSRGAKRFKSRTNGRAYLQSILGPKRFFFLWRCSLLQDCTVRRHPCRERRQSQITNFQADFLDPLRVPPRSFAALGSVKTVYGLSLPCG